MGTTEIPKKDYIVGLQLSRFYWVFPIPAIAKNPTLQNLRPRLSNHSSHLSHPHQMTPVSHMSYRMRHYENPKPYGCKLLLEHYKIDLW